MAVSDLSDLSFLVDRHIPHVEGLIDNLSVNVVLKGVREVGPNAKSGHEEDDAVGGQRSCKVVIGPSRRLICVVYVVGVVC